MAHRSRCRGFTLLELVISLTVLVVVFAGVTDGVRMAYRTQRGREMQTRVQGESRDALRRLEEDVRAASLGSSSGVIFADAPAEAQAVDGSVVAKRPAVQLFDNVPGGSDLLPVKPGTDALLVVAAMRGATNALPEALVASQTYHDATQAFRVTEVGWFSGNRVQYVLVGFDKATFARVAAVAPGPGPGNMRLAVAASGAFPDGKAEPGTRVRVAAAHLYYVDTRDRLVRIGLPAPRPPIDANEGSDLVILAEGIENLQVDCETEGALGVLGPCPAPIPAAPLDPIVEESKLAGLSGGATGGPRLTAASISSLRMLHLTAVARSPLPVSDGQGDAPIVAGNQVALLPSTDPGGQYLRRVYRLSAGVRNTSLGAL